MWCFSCVVREEAVLLDAPVKGVDARRDQDDLSETKRLLEEARRRAAEERDLSSTTETAHYAAASMGQPAYASVRGVGVVVLRRGGWSC